MQVFECDHCSWIYATHGTDPNPGCKRCGHPQMTPGAVKSPSWSVVQCTCGHKDVYSKPVSGKSCPTCGMTMS